jgi:aryl-alcohol dehydrogenase-like predicted oxidoreductase
VALSWVADRPGVTAAIAGARTMGQLDAILTAQDVLLPPEISAALDDVSAVAQARPSR